MKKQIEYKIRCAKCRNLNFFRSTADEVNKGLYIKCRNCYKQLYFKALLGVGLNSWYRFIFWIVLIVLIVYLLPSILTYFSYFLINDQSSNNQISNKYQQPNLEAITKTIEKSIVYIKYDFTGKDKNNNLVRASYTGSGVIASSNSDIIVYTNRHVVDCLFNRDCISKVDERITVRTNGGTLYEVKEIAFAPHTIDIVLLRLTKKSDDFLSANWYTNYDPKIGDKVIAIGYPSFSENVREFLRSSGKITTYRDLLTVDGEFEFKGIQSDAFASYGSSGGGLFSDKGNLIGIVTWGSVESKVLVAIDIRTISDLGYQFFGCQEVEYYYKDGCAPYCTSNEVLGIDRECHSPCTSFYCKSEVPKTSSKLCPEGYVVGSDLLCHPACTENSYCPSESICYQNQCVSCPSGTILYDDGRCR